MHTLIQRERRSEEGGRRCGECEGSGEVGPDTRALDQNGEAVSFLEVLKGWQG